MKENELSMQIVHPNAAGIDIGSKTHWVMLTEVEDTSAISAVDELVQLTPSGLFDMMRVKGLGGKKFAILWNQQRLTASKICSQLPKNIAAAIENMNSSADHFHFADVAAQAGS